MKKIQSDQVEPVFRSSIEQLNQSIGLLSNTQTDF